MQKLLVSTTAAAALLMTSLAAQAADLPKKAYAPAPVMVAAVYDWTGFYIGANGGYGTSRNCWGVVPLGGGVAIPDGCHSRSPTASSVARLVTVGRPVRSYSAWKRRATGLLFAVRTSALSIHFLPILPRSPVWAFSPARSGTPGTQRFCT
jgi:hypothetical protein